MAYIGTNAPTGFSTSAKDTFSGDNSTTAFTMSRGQSTGNDVQVFVDNVRQEPIIAYNVSGATLTFTEAPPTGTNNIYCVHNSNQAVSVLPPADLGSRDYVFGDDVSLKSDAAVLNMGLDSEIKITHVHNTGILLTDSGGSPTLQLHDSNESISSDGSNLILTSGGTAFKLPTADGTASGQVLQTDASGNLSFAAIGSGGSLSITGTTPTLTIGDAGAEDTKIVFDGNAQDFHIGLDDSEDDLVIGKGSTLGTTTHMAFDENGQVTKPLQTYFHVGIDTTGGATPQSNISTSGYENITLDNEIFDRGGNFASNQFTAPVTGIYHLTLNLRLDNVDTASSYYNVVIQTSNRAYQQLFNYPDSDIPIMMVMFTAIADMDANDVAYARIFQNGGTAQTDINGYNTSFFGYLLG